MKTSIFPLGILSLWLGCAQCLAAVVQAEPTVTERGPHHRIWQRVNQETLPDGSVRQRTSGYTQLTTGMHYWKDGQWVESRALVEIFPDGGVARQGQHQVIFSANLNTAGSIDLQTSDGKRLRTHVLGLAYTDAFGRTVMIADVKDSIGEVIHPNVVLYRDAFTDFQADVRYTYTLAGLEQDIILLQNPPSPADYGMNPNITRLEIYTEILEAPAALKTTDVLKREQDAALRQAMVEPDLTDDTINFGVMRIGSGSAFSVGDADAFNGSSVPVGKSYERRDGRQLLIEKVDYRDILPYLQRLPRAAMLKPERKAAVMAAVPDRGKAGIARHFPLAPPPATVKKPLLMAKTAHSAQGLVIDYSIANSDTNFTFRGDTTYYVGGDCQFSGTTIIEGGTVIKYTYGSTPNRIKLNGSLDCQTSQFRPAFLTAKDDDTIGEPISGSTGNPMTNYYATRVLDLAASSTSYDVHDIRVRYAERGIYPSVSTVDLILSHAQIFHSKYNAINHYGNVVKARNVLAYDLPTFVDMLSGSGATLVGEHLTLHRIPSLRGTTSGTSVFLTNSLLISVTNNIVFTGGADVVTNLSDTGIFQSAGAGAYYLAPSSPYRNTGTTGITPSLLSDLRQRTTYPPILVNSTITTEATLTPQAQRDTDTPDLGYEYDPVDWMMGGVVVTNSLMQLKPGTALATYGNVGVTLHQNGQLWSDGTALQPNAIVRYSMVQEQTATNWTATSAYYPYQLVDMALGHLNMGMRLNFTRFSVPPDLGYHLSLNDSSNNTSLSFTASNSTFSSAFLVFEWNGTSGFRNCLFERVRTHFETWPTNTYTSSWLNNTFIGGSFNLFPCSGTLTLMDNTFDGTTFIQNTPVTHNYNAYLTNASRLTNFGANDVVLATNTYLFQTNNVGRFYLPTNSLLLNAGSTWATNAGLYHFTTMTNQWKETNSVVDIGYHYVALNGSNQPVDADGDGIADWLEDLSGNGSVNSGETVWTNATDLGLKVQITNPRSNSPLP